jgi:SPOR domain
MADNGFRPPRRDGAARNGASPQRYTTSDPLAELARLIGQSDAHRGFARDNGRQAESYDDSAPAAVDWGAAEEDYSEQSRADDGYTPQPRQSYRPAPAHSASPLPDNVYEDRSYEDEAEVGARQYARAPAEDPRTARRNASRQDSHYPDEQQPRNSRAEPLPYIPPAQGGYLAGAEDAGEPGYEQADEEAPPPRRSGTIVIVAVLGLAVLGTAGALGYRAMFGGSVIPSLPPIIKPGDSPIKIVPQQAQAGATNQTDADAKDTADQLVNHEEQPVNIQTANPVPRVVTTIPVISNAPDAPLPDSQPPAAASGQALAAPAGSPPAGGDANAAAQPFGPPPEQLTGSAGGPPEAKPVHTVSILPQANPADGQAAPPQAAAPPVRIHRQPAEHTASVGPLSIVPGQDDDAAPAAAPPRPRTSSHGPMALNGATGALPEGAPERSGGGFAVQVTSQRSEAEAQAAFHSLQAKYPQQLGDRHAFVRRADLGAKGVYYRALIGPFASGADAVSLCSSLKAAGGSCLIQRN